MSSNIGTNRTWFIYALRDPRNNEIKYVGWTVNPKIRIRDHLKPSALSKHRKRPSAYWLKTLVDEGLKPIVEILEQGIGEGWHQAEQRWIAKFLESDADLTNATKGGEGTLGFRHSPESRAIMSTKRKGHHPEYATKARDKTRRNPRPEMRELLRTINIGRPKSEAHRHALSIAAKNRPPISEETRAKLRTALAKRPHKPMSVEARAKLSAERKGKPAPWIKAYWEKQRIRNAD